MSESAQSTYAVMKKPPWAPPSYVFGPVWTVLYILLAIAMLRTGLDTVSVFHICLNLAWSPIFFGLRQYSLAYYVILAMIATILPTWLTADATTTALLTPYVLWITFAAGLNKWIAEHNEV